MSKRGNFPTKGLFFFQRENSVEIEIAHNGAKLACLLNPTIDHLIALI